MFKKFAGVAQLVVHSIRNRKVMGPSPITSSKNLILIKNEVKKILFRRNNYET